MLICIVSTGKSWYLALHPPYMDFIRVKRYGTADVHYSRYHSNMNEYQWALRNYLCLRHCPSLNNIHWFSPRIDPYTSALIRGSLRHRASRFPAGLRSVSKRTAGLFLQAERGKPACQQRISYQVTTPRSTVQEGCEGFRDIGVKHRGFITNYHVIRSQAKLMSLL